MLEGKRSTFLSWFGRPLVGPKRRRADGLETSRGQLLPFSGLCFRGKNCIPPGRRKSLSLPPASISFTPHSFRLVLHMTHMTDCCTPIWSSSKITCSDRKTELRTAQLHRLEFMQLAFTQSHRCEPPHPWLKPVSSNERAPISLQTGHLNSVELFLMTKKSGNCLKRPGKILMTCC